MKNRNDEEYVTDRTEQTIPMNKPHIAVKGRLALLLDRVFFRRFCELLYRDDVVVEEDVEVDVEVDIDDNDDVVDIIASYTGWK